MANYHGKELSMKPVATAERPTEWVRLEPGDMTRYEFAWGACPGDDVVSGVGSGNNYLALYTKWGFAIVPTYDVMHMEDSIDAGVVGYALSQMLLSSKPKIHDPFNTIRYSLYVMLSYVKSKIG